MNKNYINAFWYLSSNVGDNLTPYLVNKICKKFVIYTPIENNITKYIVTGSILNIADKNCRVWGAGLANKTDKVDPNTKIYAVRGPISREIAISCGATCPEIYGDPALLMPKFYTPNTNKKYKLGIIPHYIDQFKAISLFKDHHDYKIIDILSPIENFIDEIFSCEKIISSSLHGLIISIAYNIPSLWVKIDNKILGDDTKFLDFFKSIKVNNPNLLNLNKKNINNDDIKNIFNLISNYENSINLDNFLMTCPFYTNK